ncbi:pyridoxal phosphate-dependent aminotransferase [Ferrovibrio terrae]|uniref:pyridoxal phosphate-dependent aminotransferase n=1 Tax=Ferrovibrio terrae TaxID=2594003 RepID=UPI003137D609
MTESSNAGLPVMPLSRRVQTIPEALSIYINQLVYDLRRRGNDVVTLSLGEAFFDIPAFDFGKIDFVKGAHYSDSVGIPELRKKIADYYARYYGAAVDPMFEMIITAGSKVAIFMCMQAIMDPGTKVMIHEPAWVSYQEQARLVGAEPVFIPYDCPVEKFTEHYDDKTRLVIINNPNNPAGRLYTKSELECLYRDARQRGIYVMVDEAYSDFVTDEPFTSLASIAPSKEGVIIVNSLSKNMGLSGWRIGYVITHPTLIAELIKLNQHLITCAPSILLYYLSYYFQDLIDITLPQVREVVAKRNRVGTMIDRLGLKRMDGAAGFYFFVSIGNFPGDSLDFSLHLLLEHGIAVVPGLAYGDSTKRFVRISVGTESEERIWDALNVISDLTRVNQFDVAQLNESMARYGLRRFTENRS